MVTHTQQGQGQPQGQIIVLTDHTLVDPEDGDGMPEMRAPLVQFLSFSCSYWQNFSKIIGWTPSSFGFPPSVKSWIRHCCK